MLPDRKQERFMTDVIKGNAIIGQSGGPTAAINQSLVGVIESIRSCRKIPRLIGARHGVRGIIEENFIDLKGLPRDLLERVAATPAAALGSSRDKPDEEYCQKIVKVLAKNVPKRKFRSNRGMTTVYLLHVVNAQCACCYTVSALVIIENVFAFDPFSSSVFQVVEAVLGGIIQVAVFALGDKTKPLHVRLTGENKDLQRLLVLGPGGCRHQ